MFIIFSIIPIKKCKHMQVDNNLVALQYDFSKSWTL